MQIATEALSASVERLLILKQESVFFSPLGDSLGDVTSKGSGSYRNFILNPLGYHR